MVSLFVILPQIVIIHFVTISAEQLPYQASLAQLGLQDPPMDMKKLRESVRNTFESLMHDAEEASEHDPKVISSEEAIKRLHSQFLKDSGKASAVLAHIKEKMHANQADIDSQAERSAFQAKLIREFTEKENAKLEDDERKLMQLQQHKISTSFMEVPKQSALIQLQHNRDIGKANKEIEDSEHALAELSSRIKKRVEGWKQMLRTSGHKFPGEFVL